MIIVVKNSEKDCNTVIDELNKRHLFFDYFNNDLNYIFNVEASLDNLADIKTLSAIEYVMDSNVPYLSTRNYCDETKVIDVLGQKIGKEFTIIAGPCSIESSTSISNTFKQFNMNNVSMFRGGAYKPRTSPYSFQGLKVDGLKILSEQGQLYNKPIVSEIVDINDLEYFIKYVDVIQVGARNMQNFSLLKGLSKTKKPILLKRGFANTIEELLYSAEYLLSGGNENVILCERGVRNHSSHKQIVLDLNSVIRLKQISRLPVFVDPSHASKDSSLVEKLSLAAAAVGANGLIIEVSADPTKSVSDGFQTIIPSKLDEIAVKIKKIKEII